MEGDKWIIQYKVEWLDSWLTDSVVSDKMEALHRASFLLTFEHNDVRIITPDNEVIHDHDEGKLL